MRVSEKKSAVLVTGGGKRIGKAIALHLAGMKFDIALHFQSSKRDALKTAETVQKNGGRCATFEADLSRADEAGSLLKEVHRCFPHLNTLVNNASLFHRSRISDLDAVSFSHDFNVNLTAPLILSREFAKRCRGGGNVINLLDANITRNRTSHAGYLLSKRALRDLTELAAIEFAPGIRVNGVAPGPVLPPPGQSGDYLQRIAGGIPLRRKGRPEEVAQAVQFLIENEYVTGQVLFVDGGEHLL